MDCGKCVEELDHCHGALLTHQDGAAECTDHTCVDLDPIRHSHIADCVVLAGCECGQPSRTTELRRAS